MKTIITKRKDEIPEIKSLETIEDLKDYLNIIVNPNKEFYELDGWEDIIDEEKGKYREYLLYTRLLNESYNKDKIVDKLYNEIFKYVGNEMFSIFNCDKIVFNKASRLKYFYSKDGGGCPFTSKCIEITQYDKLSRV